MKKIMVETLSENEMEKIDGGACQAPAQEYGTGNYSSGSGFVFKTVSRPPANQGGLILKIVNGMRLLF